MKIRARLEAISDKTAELVSNDNLPLLLCVFGLQLLGQSRQTSVDVGWFPAFGESNSQKLKMLLNATTAMTAKLESVTLVGNSREQAAGTWFGRLSRSEVKV